MFKKELAHADKKTWLPILQVADKNGDGEIDFIEFQQLLSTPDELAEFLS